MEGLGDLGMHASCYSDFLDRKGRQHNGPNAIKRVNKDIVPYILRVQVLWQIVQVRGIESIAFVGVGWG